MRKCIVLLMLCVLCGCNEELRTDFQAELIKSPANWLEKYGDSFESQQTANIALAIQVINRQGEAIKQLDDRLIAVEDPNDNDTVWDIDSYYSGYRIGARSDGTVVWRMIDPNE